MEDYKKKYETVIKQAKEELKACGDLDCDAARQIFRFFPELKESEDERIRKELISHFCRIRDNFGEDWYGFNINDVIAWIEKQGEQKLLNNDKYQTVSVKILDRLYEFEKELERLKQCKQKTDKVEPKFKVGDTIRSKGSTAEYTIESISGDCYHGKGWGLFIGCDEDYELVEQNPAWSEEDEEAFHCLEYTVKHYYDDKDTINKCCSWLKSLKERVKGE